MFKGHDFSSLALLSPSSPLLLPLLSLSPLPVSSSFSLLLVLCTVVVVFLLLFGDVVPVVVVVVSRSVGRRLCRLVARVWVRFSLVFSNRFLSLGPLLSSCQVHSVRRDLARIKKNIEKQSAHLTQKLALCSSVVPVQFNAHVLDEGP